MEKHSSEERGSSFDKYSEELEDAEDAAIADEAYEEYVRDGCKSHPIEELWKELGI